MKAANVRFYLEGREYQWYGGFGALLISLENGKSNGELRIIAGHMFKVFSVDRRWFRKDRVCWTLAKEEIQADDIRTFQAHIF